MVVATIDDNKRNENIDNRKRDAGHNTVKKACTIRRIYNENNGNGNRCHNTNSTRTSSSNSEKNGNHDDGNKKESNDDDDDDDDGKHTIDADNNRHSRTNH